jgi:hypothetical protein
MGAVHQGLKVAAPAIFGVQSFPISTQWRKDALVPYYLPILEEIQVDGAPLQVDRV